MTPEEIREKILHGPAAKPPPGVIPNYVDPSNLREEFIALFMSLLVISTAVVWMRMYTKIRIVRKVLLEDYLLLLSWLVYAVAYTILGFKCANLPIAVHQYDMTVMQLRHYLYWFHLSAILYTPIICPLKISIGVQCLRVFCPLGARNFTFWASHALIWMNLLFYIAELFAAIFSCHPMNKQWDPTITTGQCVDTHILNIVIASFNTLSDLFLIIIPQTVIWRLTMAKSRKIGLSAVFMVAVLACVASSVRLYYTIKLTVGHDVTYYLAMVGLWCFPEICCGFLVASLPVMPKFINVMAKKPFVVTLTRAMRSRSKTSTGPESHPSANRVANGGVQGQVGVITDIEFHELVGKSSANGSLASYERTELESKNSPSRTYAI